MRVILVESDDRSASEVGAVLDDDGLELAGIAADGPAAEELVLASHPDVALIDVSALGRHGPELAERLRTLSGGTLAIVAMARPTEAHRVAELVSAGARGYVVKSDLREVVAAVRAVGSGSGFLSSAVTRPVLDEVARLYQKERRRNAELEDLVLQLQDLSVTDWLTGLKNHGFFFERLSEELDRSLRHRRPVSIVIADIDDFKQINDTRGHAAGDRVLQEVAAIMADTVRSADVVCRVGGEEFGMVLPETDSSGAHLVADRVREQAAALSIPGVGKVTLSLGVASVPEHAVDRDELMEAADRALYLAKRDGKNRTRVAGEIVSISPTPVAAVPRSGRNQIVDLLVRVLRLRDEALATHAEHTAGIAVALGAQAALTTSQLENLRIAALLQDVGKIGVPDSILFKDGPLTPEEWELIEEHPKRGFELIGGLIHPEAAEAVLANHERWDGRGYPRRLAGEEIPLLARVLLVADAFVAMTMSRPFRRAMSGTEALGELQKNAGTQFDPEVVKAMGDLAAAMQFGDDVVVEFPAAHTG